MPRGERSQTWFPELVAELRQSWRRDPTWEAAGICDLTGENGIPDGVIGIEDLVFIAMKILNK